MNYTQIKNINENLVTSTSGILFREYEEYSWPNTLATSEDVLTQYFVPAKNGLSEIHIRLAYNNTALLHEFGADIRLVVKNEKKEIILSKDIPGEEINNWGYYVLRTSGLKKGKLYSIDLIQTYGAQDESGIYMLSWIPFIYDKKVRENIPIENLQCEYNGELQNYNWDLYYFYQNVDNRKIAQIVIFDIVLVICLILWIILARYHERAAIVLWIITLVVAIGCRVDRIHRENNMWYNKNLYIAHAMGGIIDNNIAYSNCKEAFEINYNKGFKVFEVDFSMTSDNQIVLMHDWENLLGRPVDEEGVIPTLEEFDKTKLYGKYTTLDINDLFELMLEYSDIYIVTDSKLTDYDGIKKQFTMIADMLNNFLPEEKKHIISHLIVQLYNDEMFKTVDNIIHFDHYIYTLYQRGTDNLDQLASFCVENNIKVVTMPFLWWTKENEKLLHDKGLKIFIHTLNDVDEINAFLDMGVDGIYTDYAAPTGR